MRIRPRPGLEASFNNCSKANIVVAILALASLTYPAIAQQPTGGTGYGAIHVQYPHDGSKISAPATYTIGVGDPRGKLTANGVPVRQNGLGFFAHVLKLNRGNNDITLASEDGTVQKVIHIVRPGPEKSMNPAVLAFKPGSMEPAVEQGVGPGDMIVFKVRATPGGEVAVKFGDKQIILSPAPDVRRARAPHKGKAKASGKSGRGGKGKKGAGAPAASKAAVTPPSKTVTPSVNEGLATTYGKVFQSLPPDADDLYVGFYKVQPQDNMSRAPIRFTLTKNGKSITSVSPANITVITQPYLVQTRKDDTVVRTEPGKARLTSLAQGVRLTVDGWQGTNLRCSYGPTKHVWIEGPDVSYERGTPFVVRPPPKSYVQTLNAAKDQYGDSVVIPLTQRLPYEIEQQLKPNMLTMKIYGAVADTDWASQQYKQAFEDGESQEAPKESSTPAGAIRVPQGGMIDNVTWRQASDNAYEVNVKIKGHRQWGYFASYQGTNLILHVKRPPALTAGSSRRLANLTICVDPGHGGGQPGAIGCSGVSEASVNLAMGLRLKDLLEAEGARVVMTRTGDQQVELNERVEMAKAAGADILLSVHNNSLPDGRNPWTEHGSSTYWYHPQSIEFANALQDGLVEGLGFPDIGSRYQNLALTRPTQMLAVLAEVGFMIHPDEYAQIIQPAVQEKAARALVSGIKRYLSGRTGAPAKKQAANSVNEI